METVLSFYIRQLACFKGYHFIGSLEREGVALRLLSYQRGLYLMLICCKILTLNKLQGNLLMDMFPSPEIHCKYTHISG